MTEQTKQTAERTIDAPAQDIFEILSNPERHPEIDGSGMVRSDYKTDRISGTGQMFTMNQFWDKMGGEYKTDNYVVGFDENKLLAWKTAPAGEEPPGWQWVWELESTGSDETRVSVTYDWSAVTDKEVLKHLHFPTVSKESLEDTLNRLAAAVA